MLKTLKFVAFTASLVTLAHATGMGEKPTTKPRVTAGAKQLLVGKTQPENESGKAAELNKGEQVTNSWARTILLQEVTRRANQLAGVMDADAKAGAELNADEVLQRVTQLAQKHKGVKIVPTQFSFLSPKQDAQGKMSETPSISYETHYGMPFLIANDNSGAVYRVTPSLLFNLGRAVRGDSALDALIMASRENALQVVLEEAIRWFDGYAQKGHSAGRTAGSSAAAGSSGGAAAENHNAE